MKKLFFLMVAFLLVFALIAAGCTGTDTGATASVSTEPSEAASTEAASSEAATESADSIIIGYNAYGDAVDFSKNLTAGLEAEAAKIGATVLKADTGGDPVVALSNAKTFITQGADIIIDSSWVVSACESVAKECEANDVPCIISDIYVDVDSAYYMGVDNEQVGLVTGEAVADYAEANWDGQVDQIVISYVEAFGEGVKPRVSGVPVAVRAAGIDLPEENVTWVDPGSSDATVAGKQQATDFLTAHPDDKHIVFVGANDQMAAGLLAGVETSNRSDDCIVVSVGCDSTAQANLHSTDNVWLGSTAFFPEKYGEILVNMAQDILAGNQIDKEQFVENVFITRDNIDQYYPIDGASS